MEYERKEQGRTLALSPLPLAILGLKFNVVGAFRAITAASYERRSSVVISMMLNCGTTSIMQRRPHGIHLTPTVHHPHIPHISLHNRRLRARQRRNSLFIP